MNEKVVVVIPAYKSSEEILGVIRDMPQVVDKVFVVDDFCPEKTGLAVLKHSEDKRIEVIFNSENKGVGGAVMEGIKASMDSNWDILIKIDSDGQMNPLDIPKLILPLQTGSADYSKGNRFNSLEALEQMPKMRIFGNAGLSLLSKFSTGYWSVTDPTNGFLAITRQASDQVNWRKVSPDWFFESDLLFRLSVVRAKVEDVPIKALYGSESSNLRAGRVWFRFLYKHLINFLKRIFYVYYLREWSIISVQLPIGVALTIFGSVAGSAFWSASASSGQEATVGQVMLATVPLILGVQFLLSSISMDIANEPSKPIYSLANGKRNS